MHQVHTPSTNSKHTKAQPAKLQIWLKQNRADGSRTAKPDSTMEKFSLYKNPQSITSLPEHSGRDNWLELPALRAEERERKGGGRERGGGEGGMAGGRGEGDETNAHRQAALSWEEINSSTLLPSYYILPLVREKEGWGGGGGREERGVPPTVEFPIERATL